VSKAFTDEEAAETPHVVAPRAPLPRGVPNYVTARGLSLLREELIALQAERAALEREPGAVDRTQQLAALTQRRAQLEARLASAELVPAPDAAPDVVRFGARVTVEGRDGRRNVQIVGVDEADAARGLVAFVSPLARALLGRRVGDSVRLRLPRGEEALEIVELSYSDA
jgi:transcription elongation factor GreB